MLNSVPFATARQPRGLVKINGSPAYGIQEIEVSNNNYYEADTFEVELSLSAQPASTNWAWWASQTQITVECFLGFPLDSNNFSERDLTSFILGNVDRMDINPASQKIRISGRDYTANFIDTKTTEKYPNKTSSQVAAILAANHGMQTNITATQKFTGPLYKLENARIARAVTEWDLLTFLANTEGYDVYVTGNILNFAPKVPASSNAYVLQWSLPSTDAAQFNGMSLNLSRNLTLAHDVYVQVNATDLLSKKVITASAGVKSAHAQIYTMNKSFLTKESALKLAQNTRASISQHELKLHASLPGDVILNPRNLIQLTGTGTKFDQLFYAESVTRRLSQSGFTMDIRAKNHSTESQASV